MVHVGFVLIQTLAPELNLMDANQDQRLAMGAVGLRPEDVSK
jgi:hypothetical protein